MEITAIKIKIRLVVIIFIANAMYKHTIGSNVKVPHLACKV